MARCMGCERNLLRCKCDLSIKNGRPTRNIKDGARKGNFQKNGYTWCGLCGRRVIDDRCVNGTCTRRGA